MEAKRISKKVGFQAEEDGFKQRRMRVMAAAGLMVVPNGDFLCEKLCAWDKSKGDCTRLGGARE